MLGWELLEPAAAEGVVLSLLLLLLLLLVNLVAMMWLRQSWKAWPGTFGRAVMCTMVIAHAMDNAEQQNTRAAHSVQGRNLLNTGAAGHMHCCCWMRDSAARLACKAVHKAAYTLNG